MKIFMPYHIIACLLLGYTYSSEDPFPGSGILLLLMYLLSVSFTPKLAKHLNRSPLGWTALNVVMPFVTPMFLALLPQRREGVMSDADAAWARMDTEGNPMTIAGVMMFDKPLDREKFKVVIQERLLKFDRFRQCVIHLQTTPLWHDDPYFDLNYHIQTASFPEHGDQKDLQRLAGQLLSIPLDFKRPLWQMHVVDSYGSGSALIVRIHHCIADGMALVRVLLSLTDKSNAVSKGQSSPQTKLSDSPQTSPTTMISLDLNAYLKKLASVRWRYRVEQVGKLVFSVLKLIFLLPDSKTILRGKPRGQKLTVWSESIPLDDVKALSHKMGCKINDVLLTALTGALRCYLQKHQALKKSINTRFIIPVDLRAAEQEITLGNRFGLVFLTLPLSIENADDRLKEVQKRMGDIKKSYDSIVSFAILNVIGMFPLFLESLILKIFTLKGTGVMSNVPGPTEILYLADSPMRQIMFWVPQTHSVCIGVSILSYANQVMIGVTTDKAVIADPEMITQFFQEEVYTLLKK
ncbi:wax ester/triacylglycerol synthase family O-acyltransferase [Deltaproteobacteria bacterium TL4]